MKTNLRMPTVTMLLAAATAGLSQPSITQQPQDQTNLVGTIATFTVSATGTSEPAYQWQKLDGVWTDLAGCTATDLYLTNVQTSHAGDYRVVVTNLDGVTNSAAAHLYVLAPPEIIPTVELQHQAVHVGSNAFFRATASGTAPLAYQWRRDGIDLAGRTNSTLTFSAAQPVDEGDYTVVITNVAGAVTSEPTRLWVVPPPSAYLRSDFTNSAFRYPYYYLLPTNYNSGRSYPLVCFFHGGYGDEITFTNGAGGPEGWLGYANYAENKEFASYRQQVTDPAIVVWPTLRAGQSTPWPSEYVWQTTNLLDHLISRFNIDSNRVYLIGISDGVPPVWDLPGLRRGFFAGSLLLVGGKGFTPASAVKDVPVWAVSARDDFGSVWATGALVSSLRRAGGTAVYTEYVSGGHLGAALMGMSTPAVVDWLLGQRRGAASTNEPLVAITNPTTQHLLFTGATNVSLAGIATSLGRAVTVVTWTNFANNATGVTLGSNLWSVPEIPLGASRTNVIVVVATTTSWAPAFRGTTTFNDPLTVVSYPIRAALSRHGIEAILDWTGGGPPYRVQRVTDLAAGDWADYLTDARPPVHLLPTDRMGFYRIVGQ